MADYKVWRYVLQIPETGHEQAELIVAAKSRAAGCRAFGCSAHDLKNFGSETGNEVQIATAFAAVGTVFYKALNDHTDHWTPRAGHGLSEHTVSEIARKAKRAADIKAALANGTAIWRPFRYGQGASLKLPGGIIARVEWKSGKEEVQEGYKVTVGETVLKRRVVGPREAKMLAVALARQILTAALAALPENPDLEHFE